MSSSTTPPSSSTMLNQQLTDSHTPSSTSSTCNPTIDHRTPPSISNFKFLKQISSGAFGTVHLAVPADPTKIRKVYAVKSIKKSDLMRKNLANKLVEERSALLKSRKHDFIVSLYYSIQTSSTVYFIMEFCIGGDLASLLRHMKFFPPHMASFYCAEVALALQYLHSKDIIHRDIKGANMLISKSGHIKLTDFGLSDVGVRANMSPAAPGSSPFTPGQLASLGQNLTFSHCEENSSTSSLSFSHNNSSIPSPIQGLLESGMISSLAHTPRTTSSQQHLPNQSSIHPIQHSTPVGSLAIQSIPNANHTKHRKVRIPLRKLGSRSHLSSSNLSIGDNTSSSSSSSTSLSSSWSIISNFSNQFPHDNNNEKENDEQEFNFKRVKLSPPTTKTQNSKPYKFDNSSFLDVSFNFNSEHPKQYVTTHAKQEPTTPSSEIIPTSFSTPPPPLPPHQSKQYVSPPPAIMHPVHQQMKIHTNSNFTASIVESNNNDSTQPPSPETGRLQHNTPSSHRHHFFSSSHHHPATYHSMPLIQMQKSPSQLSKPHQHQNMNYHHHFLPPLKEDQSPLSFAINPNNIKSPSWPQPDSNLGSNSVISEVTSAKKRKRLSEHYQDRGQRQQQPKSTGLTLEFSAIHLPSCGNVAVTPQQHQVHSFEQDGGLLSPPTSATKPFTYSTPINNTIPRLLGTPDYLSPELIRSAMNMELQPPPPSSASDWWSLGVCFYEFIIGVLPFNDDSPQQIFTNILDRDIEYPEGLDPDLLAIMDGLICTDISQRFTLDDLKRYWRVFGSEEWWSKLREMEAPWVPVTHGDLDTGYFEGS